MHKPRFSRTGCLIGGALLFFLLITVFSITQVPDVSKQLPPANPMLVNLSTPLDHSAVPLNTATSVHADALGVAPIRALTLWVDGVQMAEQVAPSNDKKEFTAFWSWTPTNAGVHTLLVRATDVNQQTTASNAVFVNASSTANTAVDANYQIKSGDSVEKVANQFHAPPQQIIDLNPQLNANNSLTPGRVISVPVALAQGNAGPTAHDDSNQTLPEPSPSSTPSPDSANSTDNSFARYLIFPGSNPFANARFWLNRNLFRNFVPAASSLAPQIDAQASFPVPSDCSVRLAVVLSDPNADGLFLYRIDPSHNRWRRVQTAPLQGDHGGDIVNLIETNAASDNTYMVTAFNAAGESPESNFYMTKLSNCPVSDAPAFSLTQGRMLTSIPLDKAYCYESLNGAGWTRLPVAPDSFLYPQHGSFDLSPYLQTIVPASSPGSITVALECWGWQGSTLNALGSASKTLDPSQFDAPLEILGDKFKFIGELGASDAPQDTGKPKAGGTPTRTSMPTPTRPFIPHLNLFYIAAPQTPHSAASPEECAQHMDPATAVLGSLLCAGAIQNQWLILVWDWNSPDSVRGANGEDYVVIKNIDGYHVYENDGFFPHQLVNTTSLGAPNTVAMFALPPLTNYQRLGGELTGHTARCFVVRAYANQLESGDSNTFCLSGAPGGLKTVDLTPSAITSIEHAHEHCGFGCLQTCPALPKHGPNILYVGYLHCNQEAQEQAAIRTLAWFDLSGVGALSSAILKFHKDNTFFAYSDSDGNLAYSNSNYYASCASELLLPTFDWAHTGTFPYGASSLLPPINIGVSAWDGDLQQVPPVTDFPTQDYAALPNFVQGDNYAVDATDIVRQWRNEYNNYGFALRGSDEYTSEEDNNACLSQYSNLILEITEY